MKEFALKHPIITFILFDLFAYNTFVTINNFISMKKSNKGED